MDVIIHRLEQLFFNIPPTDIYFSIVMHGFITFPSTVGYESQIHKNQVSSLVGENVDFIIFNYILPSKETNFKNVLFLF